MSYEYNTSVLNIQAVVENKMNTRRSGLKFYTVEITDFDNETEFFEVEARSESEAAKQAESMFGGDVYMMNIYITQ